MSNTQNDDVVRNQIRMIMDSGLEKVCEST